MVDLSLLWVPPATADDEARAIGRFIADARAGHTMPPELLVWVAGVLESAGPDILKGRRGRPGKSRADWFPAWFAIHADEHFAGHPLDAGGIRPHGPQATRYEAAALALGTSARTVERHAEAFRKLPPRASDDALVVNLRTYAESTGREWNLETIERFQSMRAAAYRKRRTKKRPI